MAAMTTDVGTPAGDGRSRPAAPGQSPLARILVLLLGEPRRGHRARGHPGRCCSTHCWRHWIAPHLPDRPIRRRVLKPPAWQAGGSCVRARHRRDRPRHPLAADLRRAPLALDRPRAWSLSVVVGIALGLIAGFARGIVEIADHAADGHRAHAAEPAAGHRHRGHSRAPAWSTRCWPWQSCAAALRRLTRASVLAETRKITSPPRAWRRRHDAPDVQ